jgi:outer membrane protein assembly factor BamB
MAVGLAAAGCRWGFFRREAEAPAAEPAPIASAALDAAGLEKLWSTELTLLPGTEVRRLWLIGPYVIALDSGNTLHLMDAASGIRRWSKKVAEPGLTVEQPALDGDTLWVPATSMLVRLDAATSRALHKEPLGFMPSGGCVTNGRHVYIPDGKGWLQAVAVAEDAVPWGRWMPSRVTSRPVVDQDVVVFAGHSGEIFATLQNIRRTVWEYRAEGPVEADLTLLKQPQGNRVLVPSADYSVYAFRTRTGNLDWRFDAGEPVLKPAWPSGGQVFVFTQAVGLRALDAATGQPQWRFADGADFVAGAASSVYVLDRQGRLAALKRSDGSVETVTPLHAGTVVAKNETPSGVLYLVTPAGQVLAAARRAGPAA